MIWLRLLLRVVGVVLAATFCVAALLELLPGTPAAAIVGESATPEQIEAVNREYGFDRPLLSRYGSWLVDVAQGDFGKSYGSGDSVASILQSRLPVTIQLAIGAQLIALSVALLLALGSVARLGGIFDRVVGGVSSIFIATPPFVIALVIVYIFAVRLRWFDPTGWVRLTADPLDSLRASVLPCVALAATEIGVLTRVLHDDLATTMRTDHIAAARAIGLPRSRILLGYALRPSLTTTASLAGVSLGRLIGGAIIVEYYFALPGVGQALVQAINSKDLPLVQGLVLMSALAYLVLGIVVDALHRLLDPRVAALA